MLISYPHIDSAIVKGYIQRTSNPIHQERSNQWYPRTRNGKHGFTNKSTASPGLLHLTAKFRSLYLKQGVSGTGIRQHILASRPSGAHYLPFRL